MEPGIIIKFADNRELLAGFLQLLQKQREGNPIEKQNRTVAILKKFDKTPQNLRKWICLKKSSQGDDWKFCNEQNYGKQVAEEYIAADHWRFFDGEDACLLVTLII